MWKLISLLLGLMAFAATGIMCILSGVDPLWAVVRAIMAFAAFWLVSGLLGVVFSKVMPVDGEEVEEVQKPAPRQTPSFEQITPPQQMPQANQVIEKDEVPEPEVSQRRVSVTDANLPPL